MLVLGGLVSLTYISLFRVKNGHILWYIAGMVAVRILKHKISLFMVDDFFVSFQDEFKDNFFIQLFVRLILLIATL